MEGRNLRGYSAQGLGLTDRLVGQRQSPRGIPAQEEALGQRGLDLEHLAPTADVRKLIDRLMEQAQGVVITPLPRRYPSQLALGIPRP